MQQGNPNTIPGYDASRGLGMQQATLTPCLVMLQAMLLHIRGVGVRQ
jgi:hypothetical protein